MTMYDNDLIEVPRWVLEVALEKLENCDDRGPYYAGWKSEELKGAVAAIRLALSP